MQPLFFLARGFLCCLTTITKVYLYKISSGDNAFMQMKFCQNAPVCNLVSHHLLLYSEKCIHHLCCTCPQNRGLKHMYKIIPPLQWQFFTRGRRDLIFLSLYNNTLCPFERKKFTLLPGQRDWIQKVQSTRLKVCQRNTKLAIPKVIVYCLLENGKVLENECL